MTVSFFSILTFRMPPLLGVMIDIIHNYCRLHSAAASGPCKCDVTHDRFRFDQIPVGYVACQYLVKQVHNLFCSMIIPDAWASISHKGWATKFHPNV